MKNGKKRGKLKPHNLAYVKQLQIILSIKLFRVLRQNIKKVFPLKCSLCSLHKLCTAELFSHSSRTHWEFTVIQPRELCSVASWIGFSFDKYEYRNRSLHSFNFCSSMHMNLFANLWLFTHIRSGFLNFYVNGPYIIHLTT